MVPLAMTAENKAAMKKLDGPIALRVRHPAAGQRLPQGVRGKDRALQRRGETEAGRTAEEPLNVKSYEPQSRQVLALWLFLVYNIATGEVR